MAKTKSDKTISCTCDPEGRLERVEVSALRPYQRELKALTEDRYLQLKASIERYGFTAPMLVWSAPNGERLILDGHQRLRVLEREDWTVQGGIPVVAVEAATEKEAAEKLLVIASQYGAIDKQGLFEFGTHYQLDLPEFDLAALPETVIDWQEFNAGFTDSDPFAGDESSPLGERQPDIVSQLHIPPAVWLRQADEVMRSVDAMLAEFGGHVEWAPTTAQLRAPDG